MNDIFKQFLLKIFILIYSKTNINKKNTLV